MLRVPVHTRHSSVVGWVCCVCVYAAIEACKWLLAACFSRPNVDARNSQMSDAWQSVFDTVEGINLSEPRVHACTGVSHCNCFVCPDVRLLQSLGCEVKRKTAARLFTP